MVYLYYLKSLNPLLLNPYYKNKEIGDIESEEPVTIYSANTLTQDDVEFLEKRSFLDIDKSVNLWIQEKRYYPRLFASAFAFFIMYFFLSLVIRDPIPIADEMLGSAAFAIFTWVYFARRDVKSSIVNKKKIEIKRKINEATYTDLPVLNVLENYLYELQSRDNLDIADSLTLVEGELDPILINSDENVLVDSILKLLKEKVFSIYNDSKSLYLKILKVQESSEKDEGLSTKLIEFGIKDKSGLMYLALIIQLEKHRAN